MTNARNTALTIPPTPHRLEQISEKYPPDFLSPGSTMYPKKHPNAKNTTAKTTNVTAKMTEFILIDNNILNNHFFYFIYWKSYDKYYQKISDKYYNKSTYKNDREGHDNPRSYHIIDSSYTS